MEIRTLRLACGLTAAQAATLAGVHRVTWSRWETGRQKPPAWLARFLELYQVAGGLECRGPFAGWRFGPDGQLYAPGVGRGFSAGEILALPWLWQLTAAMRREIRELKQQLAAPASAPARLLRLISFARD